ncbi:hypothetical protein [Alcanivorax sp.]|uniref:hypothetical protein n=1 Tax=Alcanivorax sp. TaxID=1872427 RepID=UPI0032D8D5C5
MSSAWSPRRKVKLASSRYPARLRWLAIGLAALVVVLSPLPGSATLLLLVALPWLVLGWRLPQPETLELHAQTLTVAGKHTQVMERPLRVIRHGPWLAMQTPKGWLHVFEDQAPVAELQPFYQWLWVKRKRG